MNKPAVTQAQIRRTVKAFEAMGKTVIGAVLRPDGSWEVRLTDGVAVPLPSTDQADTDWDKALGLQ